MILLFSDFGVAGPYTGQVLAVLAREAPRVPSVALMADAPAFDVKLSAHLLAAVCGGVVAGDVVLAIVDPGVGSESRRPVALEADGRWFVGPDNGLLDVVWGRARVSCWWELHAMPETLSATFHGRDLFAPAAARIARGDPVPGTRFVREIDREVAQASGVLEQVIYVDGYGNAMSGLPADRLEEGAVLECAGHQFRAGYTFSDVPVGEMLWYRNSSGLAELAVNQGSVAARCAIAPGAPVTIHARCAGSGC